MCSGLSGVEGGGGMTLIEARRLGISGLLDGVRLRVGGGWEGMLNWRV